MFCAIKSSRYEKLFSYSFVNTAIHARFIQKIIVLQNSLSESWNFFMRTIGIKYMMTLEPICCIVAYTNIKNNQNFASSKWDNISTTKQNEVSEK